ncbi:MAG: histidine kinase [Ruminococcus sp.]|nr:histidine kinase [Ruminococcus sp.]
MNLSVIGFISYNYISLILLFGIALTVLLNRKVNIPAINTIWLILGLVFCILVVNYISDWANQATNRQTANYWTTVLKYAINPFIICLEVVLLVNKPLKRLLVILPAAVNAFMMLVLPMISEFSVVAYSENNNFCYTNWRWTPYVVIAFYLILWLILTFTYFRQYKDKRSIVAVFIVVITLLTMYLEAWNFLSDYLDEITLIDIYLYYFYLSTVYQRKINDEMVKKATELASVKVKLLQDQISPHFIYNALAIIKSLVYEDPEKAAQTIDDFSTYLRQNVNAQKHTESTIPFTKELEHIKALQRIDEAGKGTSTDVIYDIEEDNFRVPSLTIEPLFENALLHGIGKKRNGQIKIVSRADNDHFIIQVIDNGKGFDPSAKKNGVGINNIRTRLEYFCGGTLDIQSGESGTTATVYIPRKAGDVK